MNCRETSELLSDHIDRLLPADQATAVESHLSACAACRAEIEDLRRVVAAVAALPRRAAPRNFAAGVASKIAEVSAPVATGTPRRGILLSMSRYSSVLKAVAGAAAVLLVYGVVTLRPADKSLTPQNEIAVNSDPKPKNPPVPNGELILKGVNDSLDKGALSKAGAPEGSRDNFARDQEKNWDAAPATRAKENVAVQKITVFSSDVVADRRDVRQMLGDAGYTYLDDGSLRVAIPASKARELIASIGKSDAGFRLEERKSLDKLERERRRDAKQKDDKQAQEDPALETDRDQVVEALRKLSESDRAIADAKEGKKLQKVTPNPAAAEKPQSGGRLGASAGAGATGDPKRGLEHAESEEGRGKPAPPAPADKDATKKEDAPVKTADESAVPAEGGAAPGALSDGAREEAAKAPAGDDLAEEVIEKEKANEEKLEELLRAGEKRDGDEEMVYLLIEFREAIKAAEPADAAPGK